MRIPEMRKRLLAGLLLQVLLSTLLLVSSGCHRREPAAAVAERLVKAGDPFAARETLRTYLEKQPNDAQALLLLGRLADVRYRIGQHHQESLFNLAAALDTSVRAQIVDYYATEVMRRVQKGELVSLWDVNYAIARTYVVDPRPCVVGRAMGKLARPAGVAVIAWMAQRQRSRQPWRPPKPRDFLCDLRGRVPQVELGLIDTSAFYEPCSLAAAWWDADPARVRESPPGFFALFNEKERQLMSTSLARKAGEVWAHWNIPWMTVVLERDLRKAMELCATDTAIPILYRTYSAWTGFDTAGRSDYEIPVFPRSQVEWSGPRMPPRVRYPDRVLLGRTKPSADVEALVDIDGVVLEARLVRSSGFPDFDSVACRMAEWTRFAPARVMGIPVRCWFGWQELPSHNTEGPPMPESGNPPLTNPLGLVFKSR